MSNLMTFLLILIEEKLRKPYQHSLVMPCEHSRELHNHSSQTQSAVQCTKFLFSCVNKVYFVCLVSSAQA